MSWLKWKDNTKMKCSEYERPSDTNVELKLETFRKRDQKLANKLTHYKV